MRDCFEVDARLSYNRNTLTVPLSVARFHLRELGLRGYLDMCLRDTMITETP
jgi:hypothetical protein